MKFFALKISDPDSVDLVNRIKNGESNLEIRQLNQLESDLKVGEKVFIQLGGYTVPWEKGLIGLAEITSSPYDKGYDSKNQRNFKLKLKMILNLKTAIKREEFRFYVNAFDAGGIGPTTQGEQNQAIKALEDKQAYAILRVMAEKDSSLVDQMRNIFSQDSDIVSSIFGKMPRMVEKQMTYEEVLSLLINDSNDSSGSNRYNEYVKCSLKERKEIFKKWMIKRPKPNGNGKTYSVNVSKSYATALEKDVSKLNDDYKYKDRNLFIYTIKEEFDQIKDIVQKAPNFDDINKKRINNGFSCAMDRYSEFLEELRSLGTKPLPRQHPLNFIIYGAPGTGKTYSTAEYAVAIIENRKVDLSKKDYDQRKDVMDKYNSYINSGRIVFTTFHQNYSYEDFIQGLRPDTEAETMSFKPVDGVFKKIADNAKKEENRDKNFVIIIDEINRANISKVFGELITLIEEDKRWGEINQLSVTLPSGEPFAVPNNLYIVGTMNSADKSISLIDAALRRRFTFEEQKPIPELVDDEKLRSVLSELNTLLAKDLGSTDLLVGHSYFMNKKENDLSQIMNNNIIPLLYEYYYDQRSRVLDLLKNVIKNADAKIAVEDNPFGRLRVNDQSKGGQDGAGQI